MLPEEVRNEFRAGNFVVKGKFNQVDGDQGQEWLNGTATKTVVASLESRKTLQP